MELIVNENAKTLIRELESTHGAILFYQSFGCCDGSVALCYAKKDFQLGNNDVCLASTDGIELWTHHSQVQLYKDKIFHLSIEIGNGNEYSLEYGCGMHFVFL